MAIPFAVNVNITLESTDLTTDALSIVNYMDMSPITMGGVLRRMALKVTGVDHEELAEENHFSEGAIVYVYNPSSDTAATGNISLEIGGKIIMVLGAGDWALFPWSAGQSGDDINVSGGTAGNLVEYGVFGKPA